MQIHTLTVAKVNVVERSIIPNDIIDFLKKEMRFQEVTQGILFQKIIDRVARERSLEVSDAEIQARADEFRLQHRLEKASDTLAWLRDRGISIEDWERGIRDRLLAEKLARALFDDDLEKIFTENRTQFDRVLLYQIVVPYEKVARELFYQIDEQEISFYQAAHLYDIDERRRLYCGFEGEVTRSSLPPVLASAVFGARIGEVLGPVHTERGYHLLLVEASIPAELTPQVRQELRDRLFQQWLLHELTYQLQTEEIQSESRQT